MHKLFRDGSYVIVRALKPMILDAYSWPISQLHRAISSLAQKACFIEHAPEIKACVLTQWDEKIFTQWICGAAAHLGIEAEKVQTSYPQLQDTLALIAPAILQLANQSLPKFLVFVKSNRRYVTVLTPTNQLQRLSLKKIKFALSEPLEAPLATTITTLLNHANIPTNRCQTVKKAILEEQLSNTCLHGFWLLRLSPGESFWKQIRHTGFLWRIGAILGSTLLVQIILLGGWWVIGTQTLKGHFISAWVYAWALLLITAIPLQIVAQWFKNRLVLHLGIVFRQRLLYGILQLKAETIRHQGAGQFLGMVMEAEFIESTALMGAFTASLALTEITMAMIVLALGAGGWWHALLLFVWVGIGAKLAFNEYQNLKHWIVHYREMSHDLVDRMVGHSTRIIQEHFKQTHQQEDQLLNKHFTLTRQWNRSSLFFRGAMGRSWLIVGVLGLIPALLAAEQPTALLAVSLGGILLAARALDHMINGSQGLLSTIIAWHQVAPLFHAARGTTKSPVQSLPENCEAACKGSALLEVKAITFRFQNHLPYLLQDCCLRVQKGDRLLLEGSSGSGKSTFAMLLAGLRPLTGGKITLRGLTQKQTSPTIWQRHIVIVPQSHENHLLSDSFLFNILMGRKWPPEPEDIQDAFAICHELQLDRLINKMPAGIQQMIGEHGWRLSHGERSRLFIARALLQKADLIILDESFAELDPETCEIALQCVLKHANTLLVIAHI